MVTLNRAHRELFRREIDERFDTMQQLWEHCEEQKRSSDTVWHAPTDLRAEPLGGELKLTIAGEQVRMTDWSFSQLCKLGNVSKDTVNRLSPDTASRVLAETLPQGNKPLQLYTMPNQVRSVHGTSYTRLYNADVLAVAMEFATEFVPPQEASCGGTGLYCGEQDMFAFLVDPAGWTEIEGEAFAPGFFLWNSEVGRRSVGVQTFWFQAVCQNHIVWDAVDIAEFSRKHTTSVGGALDDIRRMLDGLTRMRDQRRDGFARVVRNAMGTALDPDMEKVLEQLKTYGIRRAVAQKAVEHARRGGGLTIFSVVDALTRMSQEAFYAGERVAADALASRLLSLAA